MPSRMDAPTPLAEHTGAESPRRLAKSLALAAVIAVHGTLTVRAITGDRLHSLVSSEPVTSGRHPVHLYHAIVSAENFQRKGDCSSYDASFAAGYARASAVDFDARPYSLALLGTDRGPPAGRYKVALALWWTVAPLGFWAAARMARYGGGTALLAAGLGALVAGSGPGRQLFLDGDLGQALGAVVAAMHLACLIRCHNRPDLLGFVGLLLTAIAGWLLQPLIWGAVGLLSFGCWLGMFRRHGLRWHGAFGMAQGLAAVAALPWLADWVRYWWLTLPARTPTEGVRSWPIWDWPIWGAADADRWIALGLVTAGFLGGVLRRAGRSPRPIKWLIASSLIVTAVALAAPSVEILAPFAASGFLFLGLGLAIVPAAHGLACWLEWQLFGAGRRRLGLVFGGLAFSVGALMFAGPSPQAILPAWGPPRLEIGLPPSIAAMAHALREQTQPTARVLWEDSSADESTASVLIPLLTDRAVLGGSGANDSDLDYANLVDGVLAGRPIGLWSNAELDAFCRRYNIGWIVAASTATRDRLSDWSSTRALPPPGPRQLYAVQRPHSYVLKGRASSVRIDHHGVALADLVPESGDVVLSLHYHDGLRVRPGWIRLEREPDPYDPIPLVRLRLLAPAARATLYWERP